MEKANFLIKIKDLPKMELYSSNLPKALLNLLFLMYKYMYLVLNQLKINRLNKKEDLTIIRQIKNRISQIKNNNIVKLKYTIRDSVKNSQSISINFTVHLTLMAKRKKKQLKTILKSFNNIFLDSIFFHFNILIT